MIPPMAVVDRLRGFGQEESSKVLLSWREVRRKGRGTLASVAGGKVLRTVGWVSAGAGVLGLGLMVGRELRQRYKFNRRTPYDVYSHAGDLRNDLEFGVGV